MIDSPCSSPVTVITGAASGLGACFAHRLASANRRLILVDRDRVRLTALRDKLQDDSPFSIECFVADLTGRTALESLCDRLHELTNIELLINCAGFGNMVEFADAELEDHLDMMAIHAEAPMRLAHAVLPKMKYRNRGAIINVASLGAFAPCSRSVQYASTKAYLVAFSEGLQEELHDTNIRVQALCPGFLRTGLHTAAGTSGFDQRSVPRSLWMMSEDVVDYSLRQLAGRRPRVLVIPGMRCRMLGFIMRMPLLKPVVRAVLRSESRRSAKNAMEPRILKLNPQR